MVALSAISRIVFSCVSGLGTWEERAVAQPSYLSRKALANLQAELGRLRTVGRHNVAERIQQSRERGSIAGNAEYEEAKNEMAFIEGASSRWTI